MKDLARTEKLRRNVRGIRPFVRPVDRPKLHGIAADAYSEAAGIIPDAKAIAKRKLKATGFGFVEIVIIVYYLLAIWKLLRDMDLLQVTPAELEGVLND